MLSIRYYNSKMELKKINITLIIHAQIYLIKYFINNFSLNQSNQCYVYFVISFYQTSIVLSLKLF